MSSQQPKIGVAPGPQRATGQGVAVADVSIGRPPDPRQAAEPRDLRWYADWRRTKCPTTYADPGESLVHATLELVGEAAELAQEFQHGLYPLTPHGRARLVDEAGDVLFCASWAMDEWGFNPLRASTLPIDESFSSRRSLEEGPIARYARAKDVLVPHIADQAWRPSPGSEGEAVAGYYFQAVPELASGVLVECATTANAAKKHRYQRRQQDRVAQANRIFGALQMVQVLLALAGAEIGEAMAANVAKLDARFPDGWRPGGGNRDASAG